MNEQSTRSPVFLPKIRAHYAVMSPQKDVILCAFQTSKGKRDVGVEYKTRPNGTPAVIMHILTWSDSKP